MFFADLHIHGLAGVDDGPGDEARMYQMVQAAYADGTRVMCLTPHFYPAMFGRNRERAERAFQKLCRYARENLPELRLYLGSEVRCTTNTADLLWDGGCRTLNGTRFVLVDFSAGAREGAIVRSLRRLLDAGYIPVLAHVERYGDLPLGTVRQLSRQGVRMQLDARSVLGGYGVAAAWRARRILREGLADLAASDAHDIRRRPPQLSRCYDWVARRYGKDTADDIFWKNALEILEGQK